MATRTSQRVFIWVIAIAMIVGTVTGFIAMILAPKNQQADQARQQELIADYQAEYTKYQQKIDAQAKSLSDQYAAEFKQYENRPASFDKDAVKELAAEDLKVGDGAEVKEDSEYAIYYLGWNPSGKMFDSSYEGENLKMPLIREGQGSWVFAGGQRGSVIEGWEKGLIGTKIGGVRLLTLPSDLAYKEAGQGEDIPPNSPLKFIVMVIPAPEKIAEPEMPAELQRLYSQGQM